MKTSMPKPPAPQWVLIDAEGKTIGRLSTKVATILRGKHRPVFTPHQVCGDHVIVINASKISIPPRKLRQKVYRTHSGYLGHLRTRTLEKMMEDKPTHVIERAVKGMIPFNRLRPLILKRLHVYTGAEHQHTAQKPVPLSF